MTTPKKHMKKLVGAVEYKTADGAERSHWTILGVAFENRDGSWNLVFNYLPARLDKTTIQLRDFDDSKEDRRTAEAAASPDDLPL
jgi:hypothetical protein